MTSNELRKLYHKAVKDKAKSFTFVFEEQIYVVEVGTVRMLMEVHDFDFCAELITMVRNK